MEPNNTIDPTSVSASLLKQIKKYRDDGKTQPLLILRLTGTNQHCAVCQYHPEKLKEISESLVSGLLVSGFVFFSESPNKAKPQEIKSKILEVLGVDNLDVFRYAGDSEELYKIVGEQEQIIEEASLVDAFRELQFLAACIKFRVPNNGAEDRDNSELLDLFTKSSGYFTISLNPTPENPEPEVYLVDRTDFTLSNDPLQKLELQKSTNLRWPNPAISASLLPENLSLAQLPSDFAKILIDFNFYGDTMPNTISQISKSQIDYFWLEFGIFINPEDVKNQRSVLLKILAEGKRVMRLISSQKNDKVVSSRGARIVRGDSTFWYDFGLKKNIKEQWQTSDFDSIFSLNLERQRLSDLSLPGEVGS